MYLDSCNNDLPQVSLPGNPHPHFGCQWSLGLPIGLSGKEHQANVCCISVGLFLCHWVIVERREEQLLIASSPCVKSWREYSQIDGKICWDQPRDSATHMEVRGLTGYDDDHQEDYFLWWPFCRTTSFWYTCWSIILYVNKSFMEKM